MSKRCYIAGAGEFDERVMPGAGDYIIAADGGFVSLTFRRTFPDLLVGDFDSIRQDYLPEYIETMTAESKVIRTPTEKDDTDMMLAVKQGLERGYKEFIINGGLGGRLDHTLANIQTLVYLTQQGAAGLLVGREVFITAVKNNAVKLVPNEAGNSTVSIFCAGDKAEGITLTGLKYPLDNATITSDNPIGISNETIGKPASISVTNGTLIVMYDGGHVYAKHKRRDI